MKIPRLPCVRRPIGSLIAAVIAALALTSFHPAQAEPAKGQRTDPASRAATPTAQTYETRIKRLKQLRDKAAAELHKQAAAEVVPLLNEEIAALESGRDAFLKGKDEPSERAKSSIATLFAGDLLFASLSNDGKFTGRPRLIWNGMDDATKLPAFVFKPDPLVSFSYKTGDQGLTIVPKQFVTNGGSIPRIAHLKSTFSPWLYGPAYIIHDWLFVSHVCDLAPDNKFTFEQANDILLEAIKTLMTTGLQEGSSPSIVLEKAEDTLYFIKIAISTQFAKRIWDQNKDGVDWCPNE